MPSDPHSFDELEIPFIFVPDGDPEPVEWLQGRMDFIKLPATLELAADGDCQPDRGVGAGAAVLRGSAGGQTASFEPGRPGSQTESRMRDLTPAFTPIPSDPIAAFHLADDALQTVIGRGPNIQPTVSEISGSAGLSPPAASVATNVPLAKAPESAAAPRSTSSSPATVNAQRVAAATGLECQGLSSSGCQYGGDDGTTGAYQGGGRTLLREVHHSIHGGGELPASEQLEIITPFLRKPQ